MRDQLNQPVTLPKQLEPELRCSVSSSPQNLIAQSQSGTGKTAAFVLAMLSQVDPNERYPQVGFHLPHGSMYTLKCVRVIGS